MNRWIFNIHRVHAKLADTANNVGSSILVKLPDISFNGIKSS